MGWVYALALLLLVTQPSEAQFFSGGQPANAVQVSTCPNPPVNGTYYVLTADQAPGFGCFIPAVTNGQVPINVTMDCDSHTVDGTVFLQGIYTTVKNCRQLNNNNTNQSMLTGGDGVQTVMNDFNNIWVSGTYYLMQNNYAHGHTGDDSVTLSNRCIGDGFLGQCDNTDQIGGYVADNIAGSDSDLPMEGVGHWRNEVFEYNYLSNSGLGGYYADGNHSCCFGTFSTTYFHNGVFNFSPGQQFETCYAIPGAPTTATGGNPPSPNCVDPLVQAAVNSYIENDSHNSFSGLYMTNYPFPTLQH